MKPEKQADSTYPPEEEDPIDSDEEWEERKRPVEPKPKPKKKPRK